MNIYINNFNMMYNDVKNDEKIFYCGQEKLIFKKLKYQTNPDIKTIIFGNYTFNCANLVYICPCDNTHKIKFIDGTSYKIDNFLHN